MTRQTRSKNITDSDVSPWSHRIKEGTFIVVSAISLFLLLALITYHHGDPGWSHTVTVKHIANLGGRAGAWFADVFLYLFGYFAYLFPMMSAYAAWNYFRESASLQSEIRLFALRFFGAIVVFAAGCGLASLQVHKIPTALPFTAGGILGDLVGPWLAQSFNVFGATILLLALFLSGMTLFTGISWLKLFDVLGKSVLAFATGCYYNVIAAKEKLLLAIKKYQTRRANKPKPVLKPVKTFVEAKKVKIEPKVVTIEKSKRAELERQLPLFESPIVGSLPPISLLEPASSHKEKGYSHDKLEELSKLVEVRLQDFGIVAQVVAVNPGPVVTRFELQLAPGLKVSKLSSLSKDLARSLSVISVRIVEVIPGKSVVGLELPNEHREMVRLSEVVSSQQFDQARSPISLALGKDISGNPVTVDLAKMPHLLVAGTTGSGKSVGVNAMLLSFLYKALPEEVRLILVDPKMLELSVYEGIPHLLTPVVTDMKDAANALRWCVAEMERRYRLMAALAVRNISGFNSKIKEAEKKNETIDDPLWKPPPGETTRPLTTLPYIVVVIDEFADMMMVVGKKVEQLIARIAQKARAAGIHLILATQRPSVDVITGLIKSNIPTRISFQVSSKIDSRTIIDQQGAEQLLGHGDMLFLPPGGGIPVRIHGAFVDDKEVHAVVADWKKRGAPSYLDDVLNAHEDNSLDANGLPADQSSSGEKDLLYDEAVYFVTQSRKVSISSIQRKFKIGYNRSARIVEEMEVSGVVSTMESNGSREVLAPPPPEND